ncbi:hypothetical protein [Oceanobacillus luteolus]|uniref:Uncharacterized protein n=1 Tax=Oceanobacillus luteolus TaxID=1274358 RepID=A0ABW4HTM6_9BACI
MTQTEKAIDLYSECENANPQENMLVPRNHFPGKDVFYSLAAGMILNTYALGSFEDDWIPLTEVFKGNDPTMIEIKKVAYEMEKEGFLETKLDSNNNEFIRWCDDSIYESMKN